MNCSSVRNTNSYIIPCHFWKQGQPARLVNSDADNPCAIQGAPRRQLPFWINPSLAVTRRIPPCTPPKTGRARGDSKRQWRKNYSFNAGQRLYILNFFIFQSYSAQSSYNSPNSPKKQASLNQRILPTPR